MTIAERLTQLAEAEAVVKNMRESLRYDLDALKAALPRTRKKAEPKKKLGRPRKINGGTAPTIEDLA